MRIHVTKKLADKLKNAGFEISEPAEQKSSVLGDWHANITTIQRRQCISFGPYTLSARLCERPCSVKGMKQAECLWPAKEMRTLLEQLPDSDEAIH